MAWDDRTVEIWYGCVEFEPQLRELEEEVELARCDEGDPRYWPTFNAWRELLSGLVGPDASNPDLRRPGLYDACYEFLWRTFEWRHPRGADDSVSQTLLDEQHGPETLHARAADDAGCSLFGDVPEDAAPRIFPADDWTTVQ